MFQSVETLNPCKAWLSVADFDDALIEIRSLLKTTATIPQEKEKQALLEKAFKLASACLHATKKSNPDKQLALLFAEILRQYASLCHEDPVFITKQLFLASLGCHLYGIDLLADCLDMRDFHSLQNLKAAAVSQPSLFSAIEHSVLSMNGDTCMIRAYKSSFIQQDTQKDLFVLAESLRGLGHCYQRLNDPAATSASCQHLFRLSESLLLLAQNEISRHALADLYVKARLYLHPQPQSATELAHFYDICLHYDPSTEMKVRVAHQHFLTLCQNGHRKEALPHLHQALDAVAKLSENDKKFSLLADLCHDYARYLMHPESVDLALAGQLLATSLNYADRSRSEGCDSLPFANYDISSAQLSLLRGDLQASRNLVERALSTLGKFPHQNHDLLIQAEALRSLIRTTTIE